VQRDEILGIIRRITRDFTPVLPGLRLEVVPPEGFRARLRGKPLVADEKMLRDLLKEISEAGEGGERGSRSRYEAGRAGPGGTARDKGKEQERRKRPPESRASREERGPEEGSSPGSLPEKVPLYALPSSLTIMVEVENLVERVNREDRRLHRPLVEGLVLREVLYLMAARQPLPDPRYRAENILRRHWPFQYAALRSVGLTVTGFGHIQEGPELARDN